MADFYHNTYLQVGSTRAFFYLEQENSSYGLKSKNDNIPFTDLNVIQNMGKLPKTFNLRMKFIPSDDFSLDDQQRRVESILTSNRVITLSLLNQGIFKVKAIANGGAGADFEWDIKESNSFYINQSFVEYKETNNVVTFINNISSNLLEDIESLQLNILDDYFQEYVVFGSQALKDGYKNVFDAVLDPVRNIIFDFNNTSDILESLFEIDTKTQYFVDDFNAIGQQTINTFSLIDKSTLDLSVKIDVFSNILEQNINVDSDNSIQNDYKKILKVPFDFVKSCALINLYAQYLKRDLFSREEFNDIIDDLEKKRLTIDRDLLLIDIRESFLEEFLKKQVYDIKEVEVENDNITMLAYNENDFSNYQDLEQAVEIAKDLNYGKKPYDLNGKIKIPIL